MRLSPCLRLALAIALPLALAVPAQAQDAAPSLTGYTPTLTFGTGLINIPAAWVSPNHGDVWITGSARGLDRGTLSLRANASIWDLTLTADAHLFGRLSVGGSLYGTTSEQVGAHASLLLYRQQHDVKWLPSLAVGVRNLGASARQDRYVSGSKRVVDALPAAQRPASGLIDGSPTVYGVATREFGGEKASLGFTVGYGTGLFGVDPVRWSLTLCVRGGAPDAPSSRRLSRGLS